MGVVEVDLHRGISQRVKRQKWIFASPMMAQLRATPRIFRTMENGRCHEVTRRERVQSVSPRPEKGWRRRIHDGGGGDDALVKVADVEAKEMNQELLQELEQRWQTLHDLGVAVMQSSCWAD